MGPWGLGPWGQTDLEFFLNEKHDTEATRAELVPILGLSRPESVSSLSARFAALLQTESNARQDLMALERALGLSGENSKSV